jgi:hypothetical protein
MTLTAMEYALMAMAVVVVAEAAVGTVGIARGGHEAILEQPLMTSLEADGEIGTLETILLTCTFETARV